MHPQTDMTNLPILGRIISHGFLISGFLPVRIALPTLITMLKGPATIIPDLIILNTFTDYFNDYELALYDRLLIPMSRLIIYYYRS